MKNDITAALMEELKALRAQMSELLDIIKSKDLQIARLQKQNEELLLRLKGHKSEKISPDQPFFDFMKDVVEQGTTDNSPVIEEQVKPHTRKRNNHGRSIIPDHLEREENIIELPPEETVDLETGEQLEIIDYEESEQLAYKPGRLYVIVNKRAKYASRNNPDNGVITAPPPEMPIPKCKAHVSLLAYILVSKYGDHLPLYRLEQIFRRESVHIPRNTINGWVTACAEVLMPLYLELKKAVLSCGYVYTDDTKVPLQEKGTGKTRTARAWGYIAGIGPPLAVYDFSTTREKVHAELFLEGFKGYLHADAYGGYDKLFNDSEVVIEVACWAHARRYFYKAREDHPQECAKVLALIGQLYAIERQLKGMNNEPRLQMRQRMSMPLLKALFTYIEEIRTAALPKSKLGEAVTYALNQKEALLRYTEKGFLNIDNNAAERANRPIAIGRKNWLFVGNENGGQTLAVIYSFIESCKALDINPQTYLQDVLERIMAYPAKRLNELLPHTWKENQ